MSKSWERQLVEEFEAQERKDAKKEKDKWKDTGSWQRGRDILIFLFILLGLILLGWLIR